MCISSFAEERLSWLRIRKSRLLAKDKVTQVGIQKKGDQFYLEFIADRDTYVPVHSLSAAVKALDAIHQGTDDITEYTIRKFDPERHEDD